MGGNLTLDLIFLMVWVAIVTYELFARKPKPKKFWVVFGSFMIWLHFSTLIVALDATSNS